MLKLTSAALLMLACASDPIGAAEGAFVENRQLLEEDTRQLATTTTTTTTTTTSPGSTTREVIETETVDEEESVDKKKWFWVVPGAFFVLFAVATIWKNEKKVVRMRGVIRAGHKSLKSDQNPDSVETENKWELVHMTGKSYTETEVHDGQLDYTRGNIYRMACTAEMYQRVERREHRRKRVKRGGKMRTETEVVYVYENKWVSHPVDSSQFRRKSE
jgi:hypothetical protein